MEDNDTNPWPAEPQAGGPETSKPHTKNTAGWFSISLAVSLLLIVIVITWAEFTGGVEPDSMGALLVYSSPVLIISWISAVVCGLISRRSVLGRIGLGICLLEVCILLVGLFLSDPLP
jgi:hypothetical protein